MTPQSEALFRHILATCTDLDGKATATLFFALGRQVAETDSTTHILLDFFKDQIATWLPAVRHQTAENYQRWGLKPDPALVEALRDFLAWCERPTAERTVSL